MKRTFLILSLIFTLLLTSAGSSFAADEKEYYDEKTGAKIVKVYRVTENGLKEVPIEEYLAAPTLEDIESVKTNKKEPPEVGIMNIFHRYLEDWARYGIRLYGSRCSTYLENFGSQMAWKETTCSATKSYETNLSLSSDELWAVQADMSISWVSSASISETQGMNVSPGYRGWFRFDPLINRSRGILQEWSDMMLLSEETLQIDCPVKNNGLLDGYFVALEEPM